MTICIDFRKFDLFKTINKYKVLQNDIININKKEDEYIINIINTNRDKLIISGIIDLKNKIIFGYTNNKKKIYKLFIPFNKVFPNFLVPVSNDLSNYNKIIIIKYKNWNNELPIGENIQTYDNLDVNYNIIKLRNIYSDALLKYCGYYNIKINNDKYDIINHNNNYHKLPKYKFEYICNIDPIGCTDIDDVISYSIHKNYIIIGIHIIDVVFTLGNKLEDIHNKIFTNNIYNTVYSIIKTFGLLSNNIIDDLLSLKPNNERYVWSIYLYIIDNNIIKIKIKPEKIINLNSLSYEDADINLETKKNKYLNLISEFCNKYGKENYKTIYDNYENHLNNSHYIISLLMIITNNYIGNYLKLDDKMIYRVINDNKSEYIFNNLINYHEILKIYNYTHFTSPIRRYIDQYIHIRLYKKYFNINLVKYDLTDIKLNIINKSLDDLKIINNKYKLLNLINVNNNEYFGKLIYINYNNNNLYLKWLINNIKLYDIIKNPIIEIDNINNLYIITNRLINNKIIFKIDNIFKLNIDIIIFNNKTNIKIGIKYF